ncbi:MAG: YwaF family protein [Cellulomonadaceae bacterium]|jgi:uncharacterized membrane protein YwaF|nr:YwaF family protein [Cellulomonadaceae bacterium]
MLMTPGTPLWVAFIASIFALAVTAHYLLRGRSFQTKRVALTIIGLSTWGLSTLFTFNRILDPNVYFPFTQNLPLHFCTLVQILLAPAIWFQRGRLLRPLRAMLFYPGVAAGFLAMVSPDIQYTGQAFLSMNTLFYAVHALNVSVPILMATLGFYRPTKRDIPLALATFTAMAMVVFVITLGVRAWIDPLANFYYFFDPAGSPLLELLYNAIGIPMLYQVPFLALIVPVLFFQYFAYNGVSRVLGLASWRKRLAQAPLNQGPVIEQAAVVTA